MVAYCIFCETQRCEVIATLMEKYTGCRCFSPKMVQRKWIKGKMTEEVHSYLPGYIFLYAEEPLENRPPFVEGMIRWLGNDILSGEDLEFALMLFRKNGVIGTAKVANIGDRVALVDPAWAGMNGKVVKLDKNRKRCCVAFNFDGIERTVWLGYEMLTEP